MCSVYVAVLTLFTLGKSLGNLPQAQTCAPPYPGISQLCRFNITFKKKSVLAEK